MSERKTRIIRYKGETLEVVKEGGIQYYRKVVHPAVKAGLIENEDELTIPCLKCGSERTLHLITHMGPYPIIETEEVEVFRGGVKKAYTETIPLSINFLYYKCPKCGLDSVYPYAKNKKELEEKCKTIIKYFERYSNYSIPKDIYLYEMAKTILKHLKK